MKEGKMSLSGAPSIHNIHDTGESSLGEERFDARLGSKMEAAAGVTNNTPAAHNPIVEAIDVIHQNHLSMLEDALYRIDQILGQYK